MLRCIVYFEARAFIPKASSSTNLYTLCFEDAEIVFTDRHAVELGSSEAHRGRSVDCTRSETAPSASTSSLPDGFTLCLSSRVRT